MGQVIDFWTAREVKTPAPSYRCLRCGADLWTILADGSVRCADCEEECPLRVAAGTGGGRHMNSAE